MGLRGAWREWLPVCAPLWAGTVFLLLGRCELVKPTHRSTLTAETVMLTGLGASCVLVGLAAEPRPNSQIVWMFESAIAA